MRVRPLELRRQSHQLLISCSGCHYALRPAFRCVASTASRFALPYGVSPNRADHVLQKVYIYPQPAEICRVLPLTKPVSSVIVDCPHPCLSRLCVLLPVLTLTRASTQRLAQLFKQAAIVPDSYCPRHHCDLRAPCRPRGVLSFC